MLISSFLIFILAKSLSYWKSTLHFNFFLWNKIFLISVVLSFVGWNEEIILKDQNSFYLYNSLLSFTMNSSLLIGLLFVLIFILRSSFLVSSYLKEKDDSDRIIFILASLLGGIILISGSNLLSLFLGLELQSYSVYLLAASYKNYEPSESAGLKYFLLGGLASALVFMGIGLLYTSTGTTTFTSNLLSPESQVPFIGITLILTGFLWKMAAAPLQSWSIDVYDAVPSKSAAILSLIPKIGLINFVIKIVRELVLLNGSSSFLTSWTIWNILFLFYIITVLSLLIGSIMGISQIRIKRLLAYSSVLNLGFIFISAFSNFDYVFLFYLIQYTISTALIWLILIIYNNNFKLEVVLNSQLQGLGHTTLTSNLHALIFIFILFSLAGIPPFIGFFAKFEIILAAVKSNFLSLALVAIAASLFSTFYYLNLIKNLYFKAPKLEDQKQRVRNLYASEMSLVTDKDFTFMISNFVLIFFTLICTFYLVQNQVIALFFL